MRTTFERDVDRSTDSAPPRQRRWLRRSGDRLRLVLAVTVGAGLLAAVVGGLEVMDQERTLDEIVTHRGPLAIAAGDVHRALADADATSAVALLGGSLESEELRDRYLEDIATANAALSTAAAGSPSPPSAELIAGLANHLPTYTGLLETARANNRQSLLVGAAYMREASVLLRTKMLPAARQLHERETGQLADSQAEAVRWPVTSLLLTAVLVLWLLAVQVYLRRLTRRLLNIGLLAATLLALTAGAWLGLAGGIAAHHSAESRHNGSQQLEILAEARVAGVLALCDEALSLNIGGDGTGSDQRFTELITGLTDQDGLLARARAAIGQPDSASEVAEATDLAQRWLSVHREIAEQADLNYLQAISMMIGPDQDSATNLAARFDHHIATAAAHATDRFDADVLAARTALSGAGLAVMVLGGAVIIAAIAGLVPRIREYR